jgi:hypothetical protein
MPTVTVHFDPGVASVADGMAGFTAELAKLIESRLSVGRDKIQIMPVALAGPPIGRAVAIELKARDTAARDDALLAAFVDAVDVLSREKLGVICRIRYLRTAENSIVAAN